MGIAEMGFEEPDDGRVLIAERLNPREATIVLGRLADAGIEGQLLALPDERQSGPYDILVLTEKAHEAYEVIQEIEIAEEPDNWFSAQSPLQQALFVVVGIIAILIPLFFALVAILGS